MGKIADTLGPLTPSARTFPADRGTGTARRAIADGRLDAQAPKNPGTQEPAHLSPQAPRRAGLALQGTAKSTHPDFAAVKIFVRRETRKRAERKWEDAGGGDFSDLVETLLSEYLRA